VNRYDAKQVWAKLPHTLKSFDLYYFTSGPDISEGTPEGLRQYLRDLSDWLDGEFGGDPATPSVQDVMAAGGLSVDLWFREVFRRCGGRRLSVVDGG
jgi:hypothetical protein